MAGLKMPVASWDEGANAPVMPTPGGVLDGLPDFDAGDGLSVVMEPKDIGSIDRAPASDGGVQVAAASIDQAGADHPVPSPPKPDADPVRDLMDGISSAEGTDDAAVARSKGKFSSGYDVTLENNRFGTPSKPVSQMTLDELHQYQRQMLDNPDNKGHSSAVGKYQIVGQTMQGLEREMKLDGSQVFSPDLQDRMARRLIQESGLKNYQAGKITPEQFQGGLAKQWDSIAAPGTRNTVHGGRLGMNSEKAQGYISRIPRNR